MQEPSSPLDRRMKKFADAIAKMNEAMSDVISGMEAIPFAFHPHQQKNAFIMGVLRDKDECNLFQTISNTMLMEYDGTKYQLSLLEHAKLVDRYTVRYFDSNSKKITNVEYLVPHKNIPEINAKWKTFATPHATLDTLNDVNTYTNCNANIRIMDITQKMDIT